MAVINNIDYGLYSFNYVLFSDIRLFLLFPWDEKMSFFSLCIAKCITVQFMLSY